MIRRSGAAALLAVFLILAASPRPVSADGEPPRQTVKEKVPDHKLTPEEKAAAARRTAEEAYKAGWKQIDTARERMDEAAKLMDSKDPKEAEKGAKSREAAAKSYRKAIDSFRKATELAPDYHEAWNMLGYSYRKTGQLGKAFEAYDTCLKLKPDYAQAHEYRGEAYLMAGDLDKAKAELTWLAQNKSDEAEKLKAAIAAHERGEAMPAGGW